MFDKALVHSILFQIDEAIERIRTRAREIESADYLTIGTCYLLLFRM
jgi:hypothetical protein